MCGDFNATVDPYIDRFGCNLESPWANNWASTHRELMSTFELCDAWRACHPGVKEFTWRRTNGSQGSRIDMIWLPERYLQSVTKHSGQNTKTKYKSNVFAPRTPLSMLMGNLWAKSISY